jgi:catechol 2,3-dioxygenase-like lactoylglutathione lyase family enzyme
MQDAREHVLVLLEGGDKHRQNAEDLTHLGFAVDDPAEIDRIAEEGRREDCLHWAPRNLGPPAGKLCALRDPTGHIIEFSFGQSCGPS